MSISKYQAAQRNTESPRQAEHRLFGQVNGALMRIGTSLDVEATVTLEWNRRIWLTMQSDLARDENQLPDNLRAQLISLAIWVDKHTSKVLQGQAAVVPLIEVNRSIMEGLATAS